MSFVPTDAMLQAIAATLPDNPIAEDGQLVGLKIGLFTNNIVPTRESAIGDFTPPTFTGYAASAVTYGALFKRADGGWGYQGGAHQFQATAASPVEVCFGYYLYFDSAPDVLRGAELFPTPVSLGLLGQSCTFVHEFIALGGENFGDVAMVNP